MKKKILAGLLSLCMILPLVSTTTIATSNNLDKVKLSGGTKITANEDLHSYVDSFIDFTGRRNFSDIVRSNLTVLADGTLMCVEYHPTQILVQYYNKTGQFLSEKSIPLELESYGGFYAGKDYYFLLFAQNNPSEDKTLETFRIVKYSKDWVRLEQASARDTYTTLALRSGSASMVELNGKLYVHTSHTMYTSQKDGQRHQANLTLTIDIAKMVVTDKCTLREAKIGTGYVSHSFNQYIATATDGTLYTADQGDGAPRSMRVAKRNPAALTAVGPLADFLPFAGTLGHNFTGAQLGGIAISSTSIFTVGTSIKQGDNSDLFSHNAYISVTNRSNMKSSTKVTMITNYKRNVTSAGNPYILSVGGDRYMMLWNELPSNLNSKIRYEIDRDNKHEAVLCYAIIDKNGKQLGDIRKVNAVLSDCPPILSADGKVMWYAADAREATLYSIKVDDLSGVKPVPLGTGLSKPMTPVTPSFFKNGKIPNGLYTISYKGNYLNINKDGFAELNSSAANTYYNITVDELWIKNISIQTEDGRYLGTVDNYTNGYVIEDVTTLVPMALKNEYFWRFNGENGNFKLEHLKWEGFSASVNGVLIPKSRATSDGTRMVMTSHLQTSPDDMFVLTPKGGLPPTTIPVTPTAPVTPTIPTGATATPSSTKLTVNAKPVSVDAYNINNNNYIKLRDLAYIVNGTDKNFNVVWDGTKNAINLISKTPYITVKDDMTKGDAKTKTASPTTSKIYVNGVEKTLSAYNIGNSNYFKLRDVMQVFDIFVGYDNATATASLDTSKSY